MSEPGTVVFAERHPPEYELHKYWSRKPANVLRHFLTGLVREGDLVVDPFCGSGVLLREAAKLGATVVGGDVNPVAVALSRVTLTPPDLTAFAAAVEPILSRFDAICRSAYALPDSGQEIAFAVHEMGTDCAGCGELVWATAAERIRGPRTCPACGMRLHFGLQHATATRVVELLTVDGSQPLSSQALCTREAERSRQPAGEFSAAYDRPMWTNRRTLAQEGMTTADLFTARNFSLLGWLADQFHDIQDIEVREAALLLLTGSAAQCSRLIAYRGRLSSGGPAWTVPGFWVPPVHLEGNPARHLRARYRRFCRGLAALGEPRPSGKARVEEVDARGLLRELTASGQRADLIFLDPPYGDSVPYVEFSVFWNAFLARIADADADISVSDRAGGGDWTGYEVALGETIAACSTVLSDSGHLLITFNSHDPRAWRSLLGALQSAGLRCQQVAYQVPAVVPTKAQFAPKTSYVSDIYSVYGRGEVTYSEDLTPVREALVRCASARGGSIFKNLALRTVALAWMGNNISVDLLGERDRLLNELFEAKGEQLTLRAAPAPNAPRLAELTPQLAAPLLEDGPRPWRWLYERVAAGLIEYGLPEPGELRVLLEGTVEFDGALCHLPSGQDQLSIC